MAGRRPKSRLLKILTGNPGKRRVPDTELTPTPGKIVIPPSVKTPRQRQLWKYFGPGLEAIGTLTWLDTMPFARWCILMASFEEKDGAVSGRDQNELRQLEAILGIGAPSRTRLSASREKQDPSDAFFETKA